VQFHQQCILSSKLPWRLWILRRIALRNIKDWRQRDRKNQFAPTTSLEVINSTDSTILFAGCASGAREGNDIGALRRVRAAAGAVRQSIKLADDTAASGYHDIAPGSRNFKSEGGSSLISSSPEFKIRHVGLAASGHLDPSLPAKSISRSPINYRECERV